MRTVIELIKNENQYAKRFTPIIGPFWEAIRHMSRNFSFSELIEVAGLSNVLKCNVRSVYPRIQYRTELDFMNNTFEATQQSSLNTTIYLLWTNTQNEILARQNNAGNWSPNHFVPLLLSSSDLELQTSLSQSDIYSPVSLFLFVYTNCGE